MSRAMDVVKLTAYFGESDRAGRELVSDALLDVFEEHRVRSAILLRGIEGFGVKHVLHTQRLLTLSEDLPLISVALDETTRIDAALPAVRGLVTQGLVTLERARVAGWDGAADLDPTCDVKLTISLGRTGPPGFRAVVDILRRHGVAGATVLLGIDGIVDGDRQRARFFSANRSVPIAIVSVGAAAYFSNALDELSVILPSPQVTFERVHVGKRDGARPADLPRLPELDGAGFGLWQKLTVYSAEQAHVDGHPLHVQLVRRLREAGAAGAAGATTVRGIWGYSGDHAPHGDTMTSIRRQTPVVTTVIDRPEAIRRWWEIVDETTRETGLVTSETIPALRALGPGVDRGGLRLANP